MKIFNICLLICILIYLDSIESQRLYNARFYNLSSSFGEVTRVSISNNYLYTCSRSNDIATSFNLSQLLTQNGSAAILPQATKTGVDLACGVSSDINDMSYYMILSQPNFRIDAYNSGFGLSTQFPIYNTNSASLTDITIFNDFIFVPINNNGATFKIAKVHKLSQIPTAYIDLSAMVQFIGKSTSDLVNGVNFYFGYCNADRIPCTAVVDLQSNQVWYNHNVYFPMGTVDPVNQRVYFLPSIFNISVYDYSLKSTGRTLQLLNNIPTDSSYMYNKEITIDHIQGQLFIMSSNFQGTLSILIMNLDGSNRYSQLLQHLTKSINFVSISLRNINNNNFIILNGNNKIEIYNYKSNCENDCSGQGKCEYQVCKCNYPYFGKDCSVMRSNFGKVIKFSNQIDLVSNTKLSNDGNYLFLGSGVNGLVKAYTLSTVNLLDLGNGTLISPIYSTNFIGSELLDIEAVGLSNANYLFQNSSLVGYKKFFYHFYQIYSSELIESLSTFSTISSMNFNRDNSNNLAFILIKNTSQQFKYVILNDNGFPPILIDLPNVSIEKYLVSDKLNGLVFYSGVCSGSLKCIIAIDLMNEVNFITVTNKVTTAGALDELNEIIYFYSPNQIQSYQYKYNSNGIRAFSTLSNFNLTIPNYLENLDNNLIFDKKNFKLYLSVVGSNNYLQSVIIMNHDGSNQINNYPINGYGYLSMGLYQNSTSNHLLIYYTDRIETYSYESSCPNCPNGVCNQITKQCQCNQGYFGLDCSNYYSISFGKVVNIKGIGKISHKPEMSGSYLSMTSNTPYGSRNGNFPISSLVNLDLGSIYIPEYNHSTHMNNSQVLDTCLVDDNNANVIYLYRSPFYPNQLDLSYQFLSYYVGSVRTINSSISTKFYSISYFNRTYYAPVISTTGSNQFVESPIDYSIPAVYHNVHQNILNYTQHIGDDNVNGFVFYLGNCRDFGSDSKCIIYFDTISKEIKYLLINESLVASGVDSSQKYLFITTQLNNFQIYSYYSRSLYKINHYNLPNSQLSKPLINGLSLDRTLKHIYIAATTYVNQIPTISIQVFDYFGILKNGPLFTRSIDENTFMGIHLHPNFRNNTLLILSSIDKIEYKFM